MSDIKIWTSSPDRWKTEADRTGYWFPARWWKLPRIARVARPPLDVSHSHRFRVPWVTLVSELAEAGL